MLAWIRLLGLLLLLPAMISMASHLDESVETEADERPSSTPLRCEDPALLKTIDECGLGTVREKPAGSRHFVCYCGSDEKGEPKEIQLGLQTCGPLDMATFSKRYFNGKVFYRGKEVPVDSIPKVLQARYEGVAPVDLSSAQRIPYRFTPISCRGKRGNFRQTSSVPCNEVDGKKHFLRFGVCRCEHESRSLTGIADTKCSTPWAPRCEDPDFQKAKAACGAGFIREVPEGSRNFECYCNSLENDPKVVMTPRGRAVPGSVEEPSLDTASFTCDLISNNEVVRRGADKEFRSAQEMFNKKMGTSLNSEAAFAVSLDKLPKDAQGQPQRPYPFTAEECEAKKGKLTWPRHDLELLSKCTVEITTRSGKKRLEEKYFFTGGCLCPDGKQLRLSGEKCG
jgi:hypothetical protein